MRNKKTKQAILQLELVKYCKQIGVIDCEIPKLIFDRNEYLKLREEACLRHHYNSKPNLRRKRIGECVFSDRLIFVYPDRHYNLKHMIHTLVHELVHYRFGLKHGSTFESRINKILKGGKISS